MVNIVNPDGAKAPEAGAAAYADAADAANGVIGLNGYDNALGQEQLTINKPNYLDLSAQSTTVDATKI